MIVTKDAYLAERLRVLRSYGTEDGYDQVTPGLNARMSELHALMGIESLSSFRTRQKHRFALVQEYKSCLPDATFQETTRDSVHAFKDFALLLGDRREKVEIELTKAQVPFKRYFKPISSLSCYKGWLIPQRNSLATYNSILELPLHDNMIEDDCRRIAKVVSGVLKGDTLGTVGVAVHGMASTVRPSDSRIADNGRLV